MKSKNESDTFHHLQKTVRKYCYSPLIVKNSFSIKILYHEFKFIPWFMPAQCLFPSFLFVTCLMA